MPHPIGGAFALHRARKHSSLASTIFDTELAEYLAEETFIQANLECTVKFPRNVIPPGKWKLEGEMVLEAYKDIEFSGIFVLLTGLPVDQTLIERHRSNVKFTVEGSTYSGDEGGEYMQIDKKSRECYQLKFEIPEELPPPVITSEGKLIFRMQTFISTLEGRHVKVGEVPVRWMGRKVPLGWEELEKQLVIEQHVSVRRTFTMGRRRSCRLEWRVERGGYLPGEGILVEVFGGSKDKEGMEVEVLVELLQKVWYQVPSRSAKEKMWVNMKTNILASSGSEQPFEVDWGGGDKKVVWMGKLKIPKMITPTQKFELINSVSYAIRASAGVAGENMEYWVKGEVPLIIGTSKEGIRDEKVDSEWDDEEVLHPFSPSGSTSHLHTGSLLHRRGSGGSTFFKRSQSMEFIHGRLRSDSASFMKCLASSTLSLLKSP